MEHIYMNPLAAPQLIGKANMAYKVECLSINMATSSFLVTTSKALVTSSDALVTSSFKFLVIKLD